MVFSERCCERAPVSYVVDQDPRDLRAFSKSAPYVLHKDATCCIGYTGDKGRASPYSPSCLGSYASLPSASASSPGTHPDASLRVPRQEARREPSSRSRSFSLGECDQLEEPILTLPVPPRVVSLTSHEENRISDHSPIAPSCSG